MRKGALAEQGRHDAAHGRIVGQRVERLEPLDLVIDLEVGRFALDAGVALRDRVHRMVGFDPSRVGRDRGDPGPQVEHDVRVDRALQEDVAVVGEALLQRDGVVEQVGGIGEGKHVELVYVRVCAAILGSILKSEAQRYRYARRVSCPLSVVVVADDMARELPRTLRTLRPPYQQGIDADDYEIVLVDNGSAVPFDLAASHGIAPTFAASGSIPRRRRPRCAANTGLAEASGELVGLVVDGARIGFSRAPAHRAAREPARTSLCDHLPRVPPRRGAAHGRGRSGLRPTRRGRAAGGFRLGGRRLPVVRGEHAGRFFGRGWFGPMGESSSLFLSRELWTELGGLDEQFDLPGGGLVNHDLYRRACALRGRPARRTPR